MAKLWRKLKWLVFSGTQCSLRCFLFMLFKVNMYSVGYHYANGVISIHFNRYDN